MSWSWGSCVRAGSFESSEGERSSREIQFNSRSCPDQRKLHTADMQTHVMEPSQEPQYQPKLAAELASSNPSLTGDRRPPNPKTQECSHKLSWCLPLFERFLWAGDCAKHFICMTSFLYDSPKETRTSKSTPSKWNYTKSSSFRLLSTIRQLECFQIIWDLQNDQANKGDIPSPLREGGSV